MSFPTCATGCKFFRAATCSVFQFKKLTSVFHASVLVLIMNFVITLSREWDPQSTRNESKEVDSDPCKLSLSAGKVVRLNEDWFTTNDWPRKQQVCSYGVAMKKLQRFCAHQVGLTRCRFCYPSLKLMIFVLRLSGGNLNQKELGLDGHDVWRAISYGEASPRSEILHNIDIESDPESKLGFAYQGIGLRLRDMKLLMGVPNISYFIPPEDRGSTLLSLQDLESVSVKSINLLSGPQ